MSFKIGDMKYIDSYVCLGESLDKLVKHLDDKNDKVHEVPFHEENDLENVWTSYDEKDYILMNG